MVGMLTGEDDRSFGVGRALEGLDTAFVDSLSLLDGLKLVLEAHANGADVGLHPDESRSVAEPPS